MAASTGSFPSLVYMDEKVVDLLIFVLSCGDLGHLQCGPTNRLETFRSSCPDALCHPTWYPSVCRHVRLSKFPQTECKPGELCGCPDSHHVRIRHPVPTLKHLPRTDLCSSCHIHASPECCIHAGSRAPHSCQSRADAASH